MSLDTIFDTYEAFKKSVKKVDIKNVPAFLKKQEEAMKATLNEAISYKMKYDALLDDPVILYIVRQNELIKSLQKRVEDLENAGK